MTAAELREAAREAGAAGTSWTAFLDRDEVQEALCEHAGKLDACDPEQGFLEGLRAHREKTWVSVWTTASERYDMLGSFTAEGPFEWRGKQLRRALLDPAHADSQRARYASGLCGDWDEDPRETEARIAEGVIRARVDRVMLGFRVAAGHAWLTALSDEELVAFDEGDTDAAIRGFGLGWDAHRRERERRAETRVAAERAVEWARCRALVPDGVTLIDLGKAGYRDRYGRIPGREPDAWRAIKVEPHWSFQDDAEQARVVGEGPTLAGTYVGSLAHVAGLIERGEMRLAHPGEHVPPRAVVDRIGRPYTEILRVEGAPVWVGEPTFARDPLVLDDAAKLVRKKKVVEAALAAWREHQRSKWGGA